MPVISPESVPLRTATADGTVLAEEPAGTARPPTDGGTAAGFTGIAVAAGTVASGAEGAEGAECAGGAAADGSTRVPGGGSAGADTGDVAGSVSVTGSLEASR
jgi:hypothetical protein